MNYNDKMMLNNCMDWKLVPCDNCSVVIYEMVGLMVILIISVI